MALNNLGFDWLLFVSGKTCVLVEFASTMGDSGLGIVRHGGVFALEVDRVLVLS